jgi:hypothetical protein
MSRRAATQRDVRGGDLPRYVSGGNAFAFKLQATMATWKRRAIAGVKGRSTGSMGSNSIGRLEAPAVSNADILLRGASFAQVYLRVNFGGLISLPIPRV